MGLRFPYKLISLGRPIWSLGGRSVRPRPLLTIGVLGPGSAVAVRGIVDPAADDTVFPDKLAWAIGIDLSNAPTATFLGVGAQPASLRYAEVELRLTNGNQRFEWPARVGFVPFRLQYALLGFAGFLQFFTATFHGDREEVELTANALYPGTSFTTSQPA